MSNLSMELGSTESRPQNTENIFREECVEKNIEYDGLKDEGNAQVIFSRIATCAKQIIINPHERLTDILFIFDHYKLAPDIIILTLFKIFQEILPSYQPIKGNSKESKYEGELMMFYEKYLGILLRSSDKNIRGNACAFSESKKDLKNKNIQFSDQTEESTEEISPHSNPSSSYSQVTDNEPDSIKRETQNSKEIATSSPAFAISSQTSPKQSDTFTSTYEKNECFNFKEIKIPIKTLPTTKKAVNNDCDVLFDEYTKNEEHLHSDKQINTVGVSLNENIQLMNQNITPLKEQPALSENRDINTDPLQNDKFEEGVSHASSSLHNLKLQCVSKLVLNFPEFPHIQKLIAFLIKHGSSFAHVMNSNDLKLIYQVITGLNNTVLEDIPRHILESVISLNISEYRLVQDKFMTGYFYEREKGRNNHRRSENTNKREKMKSKKEEKTIMSKVDRKEEKIRKKLENKRLEEEGKTSEEEMKKIELKVCNGILKLFLQIMKRAQEYPLGHKKACLHLVDLVFVGLRKLHLVVKEDLLEGIKIMIFDVITKSDSFSVRFQGILAINTLFENKNLDLKGTREIALSILKTITCDMSQIGIETTNDQFSFKLLCKALKTLLLSYHLPIKEVFEFLKYLMLLCSLTYSQMLFNLILEVREFYEIEEYFTAIESIYRKMYYYC